MLSFYRRARELAEFSLSGKVRLGGQLTQTSVITEKTLVFLIGKKYTRKEIHAILGGSEIEYLPTEAGRVVCGCFTLDHNPEAPEVIIPGTGRIIEREAALFCSQTYPIPIFIKRRPNEWEYVGDYQVVSHSTEVEEIAAHHKGAITPLNEITRVIFLKCAGAGTPGETKFVKNI